MDRLASPGDRIGPVTLYHPNGDAVPLRDLLDRPVVLPLVRYYGCMPCRDYLYQLNEQAENLDSAGVRVVGVGGAADYQARNLMQHGIEFPLLLDPGHDLYRALDIQHIHWWMLARLDTWRRYARAARRARQGRMTDHPLQAPGLAIVDTDGRIRFLYRGRTLGDYPPIPDVLTAVRSIAATSPGLGEITPDHRRVWQVVWPVRVPPKRLVAAARRFRVGRCARGAGNFAVRSGCVIHLTMRTPPTVCGV